MQLTDIFKIGTIINKKKVSLENLQKMVGQMVVRVPDFEQDLFSEYITDKPALLISVDPEEGIVLDTKDEFKAFFGIDSIVKLPITYIDSNWRLLGGEMSIAA